MKIIIDTNIIFSCLLNSNNEFSKIIFFPNENIDFYSCSFMLDEISKHWDKLKKYSKLDDKLLHAIYLKILSRINFINENFIPSEIWRESESNISNIDIHDVDFVALTYYLKGSLWTSDKKLLEHLRKNNFVDVISTSELKDKLNLVL